MSLVITGQTTPIGAPRRETHEVSGRRPPGGHRGRACSVRLMVSVTGSPGTAASEPDSTSRITDANS
jgi:hypothetical protein